MATALDTGITPITTTKIASLDVAGNCTVAEINSLTTQTDVGLANVDNTADVNKNVATAGALTVATTINGESFDGSGPIVVTANAGTLSGTSLKPTVTFSSLTSVGTIGTGVWRATAIEDTYVDYQSSWVAPVSRTHTASGNYTPDASSSKVENLATWTADVLGLEVPTSLPDGAMMSIFGVKSSQTEINFLASAYKDMHGLLLDFNAAPTGTHFSIGIQRAGSFYHLYFVIGPST